MSPLYLKLAALGIAGVTVATIIPLSVIKVSGDGNQVQVQRQLDSNSANYSSASEDLSSATDRSNYSEGVISSDSSAQQNRSESSEGVNIISAPISSEVKNQITSVQEEPQIKDCKEIAKSYEGRLTICYSKKDDTKVTFKFISFLDGSSIDNIPHEVGKLKFSYPKRLSVEVLKIDNGGREDRTISLDLHERVFGVDSSFILNKTSFIQEQCIVSWTSDGSSETRIDWKVTC